MKDNENYKEITVLAHYYLGILEVEERGGGVTPHSEIMVGD